MSVNGRDRDVVITGLGVVSPLGIGIDAYWEGISTGRSGVRASTMYPGFASPDQIGAEVLEFTEESAKKTYLKEHRKNLKAMCREIQLGVASAMLALQQSKIDLKAINHERLGVEFGANLMLSTPATLAEPGVACRDDEQHEFSFERWGAQGIPRMEPLWLLRYLPNMPACHISIVADARGPSNSLTLDEASGNVAIGEAQRILLRDAADIMITGSTGTTLHPIKTLHLALFHELATSPKEAERRSRPFDKDASGRVPAEGACSLILEDRAHAESRGAKIWGRVLGTGGSTVTDRQGKPKFRQAFAQCMKAALRSAGLTPNDIGHINAHGAGIPHIDLDEALAIHDVFGADLGSRIPVTAAKSYLGSCGAGAGTLELAASLIGLSHGVIPGTLNFEAKQPDAPTLNIVQGEPRPTTNKVVLNVSMSRIGQASAAIVQAN